jgi:lysophospholipase
MNVCASDGLQLRASYWPIKTQKNNSQNNNGTVCLFQGRSEFIEKYAEVISELNYRGFAVMAFDWRGQGGSHRFLSNSAKGHIDDFDLYIQDIDAILLFMDNFAPKPWFALAHSMGATALMLALNQGEKRFERVVFSAPMVQLAGLRTPVLAKTLAFTLDYMGFGGCFVPGGGNASISSKPFEGNVLTSDAERYARATHILLDSPEISIGSPTISWAAAAFRAMDALRHPDFGSRITTPSLIITAGADRLCSSPAALELATRLRRCKAIELVGAKHELLMERDAIRKQFWAAFDAFIAGELI